MTILVKAHPHRDSSGEKMYYKRRKLGRKWKLIMDCRQSRFIFPFFPFLSPTLHNVCMHCAQERRWMQVLVAFQLEMCTGPFICSFIKILLSHFPEAVRSLTLSHTHCHVNSTTCPRGCSRSKNTTQLSFPTCKQKGGAAGFYSGCKHSCSLCVLINSMPKKGARHGR